MGYSTDLFGEFEVSPALTAAHRDYLAAFSASRRRVREDSPELADDPKRIAVGLPLGDGCGYYVGAAAEYAGDCNTPPPGQPGLWCQWIPNDDGTAIVWDEGEKFYMYVDWLHYIVTHFLMPWGYTLNGECSWQGDESNDRGVIYVKDNQIEDVSDSITNCGPSWNPVETIR